MTRADSRCRALFPCPRKGRLRSGPLRSPGSPGHAYTPSMKSDVLSLERPKLELVGCLVEVQWSPSHAFAKKPCDRCLYTVRGLEGDMVCLELVYDAKDGVHRTDSVYWVNILAVSHLRVLTEREARTRIEYFEREFESDCPRD